MNNLILKAKHNIIIYPFFKFYSVWKTKLNFNPVEIRGKILQKDLPVLLLSNHSTWFDGFWAEYINQKIFSRKFHFMMLESQLRRYWFFNYCGGFSVRKNSRSVLETIGYTAELLSDPGNIVLVFPQGEIQSIHNQTFRFERGAELILKKLQNQVQVVFLVSLTDFYSSEKPCLHLYLQEYIGDDYTTKTLESAFAGFYNQCIGQQIQEAK